MSKFTNLIKQFKVASKSEHFCDYVKFGEKIKQQYFSQPLLVCPPNKQYVQLLSDNIGSSIMPDGEYGLTPVLTTPDGNCLYNSCSIAIQGNEFLAEELRLRTTIELLINHKWYTQAYSGDNFVLVAEENLDKVVRNMWKNGVFSNVWAMVSLASVINCPIRSVYPAVNRCEQDCVKFILDKVFYPRETSCSVCNQIFGSRNEVIGRNNTICGNDNKAVGNDNYIVGFLNEISGDKNTTIGNENKVISSECTTSNSKERLHDIQHVSSNLFNEHLFSSDFFPSNFCLWGSNKVVGNHNSVTGSLNKIDGDHNTILGNNNFVIGNENYVNYQKIKAKEYMVNCYRNKGIERIADGKEKPKSKQIGTPIDVVVIMWSSSRHPTKNKVWTSNHFVPLLPIINIEKDNFVPFKFYKTKMNNKIVSKFRPCPIDFNNVGHFLENVKRVSYVCKQKAVKSFIQCFYRTQNVFKNTKHEIHGDLSDKNINDSCILPK